MKESKAEISLSLSVPGLAKFSHMGKTNSTLLNLLSLGLFITELHVILSNMQILLISVHCSGTEVLVKGGVCDPTLSLNYYLVPIFLRQLQCGDSIVLKHFIYTCKIKLCILFTYIIFATSSDVLTLFAILFLLLCFNLFYVCISVLFLFLMFYLCFFITKFIYFIFQNKLLAFSYYLILFPYFIHFSSSFYCLLSSASLWVYLTLLSLISQIPSS